MSNSIQLKPEFANACYSLHLCFVPYMLAMVEPKPVATSKLSTT
jgi:hypothetical protein